jgi:transcriptional regulator with XRE-family HTH domain
MAAPIITMRDAVVNTNRVRPISRLVNNRGMGFKENLRRYRVAAELTQEQLALACGFSGQSRIANYEKGARDPDFDDLEKLARALSVDKSDLLGGSARPAKQDDWRDVQAYAQAAGLGTGAEADEYAETHKLKFKATSLRRKRLQPDKLAVFYGKGDSMEPRIKDGDAILFDTSDTRPVDSTVYVILWKSEYYAKRAMILDDVVYFTTDNPSGDHNWSKPKRMDAKREPITIIGRVRWIGSWED